MDTVTYDAHIEAQAYGLRKDAAYSWHLVSRPSGGDYSLETYFSEMDPVNNEQLNHRRGATFSASVPGDYVIEVRADDGVYTVTDTVTITVNPGTVPGIAN